MSAVEQDYKALVKDALAKINSLKGRLRDIDAQRHAPIAIVGYGCRLPGGIADEAGINAMLHSTQDTLTTSAQGRFNLDLIYDAERRLGKTYARALGLIDGFESFDNEFFGISDAEAERLDPQQRLLLETSWEALERAGIIPERLAGTQTGVYVGLSTQEFAQAASMQRYPEQFTAHDGPGSSLAVAAGRLAYFYGLQGPALAIDTACSSVLVCVHEAMQALRSGNVDTALAGGVNLIINPVMMLVFAQAGVLSSSEQQRCFDDSGDGYVRAEACSLFVLKRLQDALDEGLPVFAVIQGGAVNHGGRSQGITTPSENGQQAVMQAALKDAGLTPDQVDCVEAHATGTAIGDYIELSALHEVYGRARSRPLWLSSVKARVGHAETGSAGPALLSAMQQLRARALVPQLHYRTPNALFEWHASNLGVVDNEMAWPGEGVVAVSAFGYNGTNAHLIMRRAETLASNLTPSLHGLKVSARTPDALAALLQAWDQRLQSISAEQLPALLAKANAGRADFAYRVWLPGISVDAIRLALKHCLLAGLPTRPVRSGRLFPHQTLPLSVEQEQQLVDAWLAGAEIDWRNYYSQLDDIELPTYSFQRKRFWWQASSAGIDSVYLQKISHSQCFLGKKFDAPGDARYHGYLSDIHVSMTNFRLSGQRGVPPLWPLAAVLSALPLGQWKLSQPAWGQWPALSPDVVYPLHTCISEKAVELQWRQDANAQWQRLFHCQHAEASLNADVKPNNVESKNNGIALQKFDDSSLDNNSFTTLLSTDLAKDPYGSWIDRQESHAARVWLAFLNQLQTLFQDCQRWVEEGQVLLPVSADNIWVDTQALYTCLTASTKPIAVRVFQTSDSVTTTLLTWEWRSPQGDLLLRAQDWVWYRVPVARLQTVSTLVKSQKKAPEVDLAPLKQAISEYRTVTLPDASEALQTRLLALLIEQLQRLTGNTVTPEKSLLALGVDSLWAMEFRARLQTDLGLQLPLPFLMKGPSVEAVIAFLVTQITDPVVAPINETTNNASIDGGNVDEVELLL